MDQKPKMLVIYYPILLAVMLSIGVFLGARLDFTDRETVGQSLFIPKSDNVNKLNQIINYIDRSYVDSVDKNMLIEKTIESMLSDLDPHSYYISAAELREYTEPLEGNFDGIGVEFIIQKDTVVIVHPVQGGPSADLGILAGDRIVIVDGENIAGNGITNDGVMKRLRGESGTKVVVEIQRQGSEKLLEFEITRGKIPLRSVDVAMMATEDVGYIKVARFAKTTYEEFLEGAQNLIEEGMTKLVLDLRNNGGGFMNAAVSVVDEFLSDGKMIVYTEGKAHPRESYYSTEKGILHDVDVVVLINHGSASASEIVAGAIQDNDRGTIIGRRSFGKGLVQHHAPLRDGSALRLTIARYYTPTGRCIQRPYGDGVDYEQDFLAQVEEEAFAESDSIPQVDSLRFITPGGKVVYGGGGIMPDLFIPADTTSSSVFFNEVSFRGYIREFAFDFTDANRSDLQDFGDFESFNRGFKIDSKVYRDFVDFSISQGVDSDPAGAKQSREEIALLMKAYIARNIWNNNGFYPIYLKRDKVFQRALEVM